MVQRLWYHFVLFTTRNLFFRLRVGKFTSITPENLPRQGGVLIAPLHVSHLDPPAVACGVTRPMWFMAKEELFKHWLIGPALRSVSAFPVKRGEGDTESIRHAMGLLEKGEAVLIFPEGTRGDGKVMGPINKGVALIAKRTGVPVVPVGVVGTHIALPRGAKKLKRHSITLIYGKPFTYAEVTEGLSDREARERFAEVLKDRIRESCATYGLMLE